MKNIYIGDIHGRDHWKKITSDHADADNIIFIGDYLDSHDIDPLYQLHNLKEIIQFKKSNPDRVHLLIGNHDIHYWSGIKDISTSGYQPTWRHQYEELFRDNKYLFKIAIIIGDTLCSHAGVSIEFLNRNNWSDDMEIDTFLNDLFKYKPQSFLFDSYLPKSIYEFFDPYGDNTWQTPLWIRPRSLQRANKKTDLKKNYIQIVGHTSQDYLDINGKSTGGRYYYIDTLDKGEYLIYSDGEFKVGMV